MRLNYSDLNQIWDQGLIDSMCGCATDDKWEQDITGYIFCSGCKNWIVKPANFEERMERKVTITNYEFVEDKGLSGVLFPNGVFLKCGNTEHNLLITDIPIEVQFGCLYFSSKLNGDRDGIITHSPVKFQGVTALQLNWIDEHMKFYDDGQKRFDCRTWKKNDDN
ncbi:hypothetical protein [Paenibacillus periandrae]|uniref:hypothetical protein n=1 Tax=Paenibacillus periandrae TaxID=1761741 RepID=UPI001F08D2DA|nr:hypothetical protein [Paenibacillus periandrae]